MLSDQGRRVLTFLLLLCVTVHVLVVSLYHGVQEVEEAGGGGAGVEEGGDCLRLSKPAFKKTPRETERVIERGKEREEKKKKNEGREDRGDGEKEVKGARGGGQ